MQFVKDGGESSARKKSKLPIASKDKESEEPEEDGSHSLEDGAKHKIVLSRGTEESSGNEKSNEHRRR